MFTDFLDDPIGFIVNSLNKSDLFGKGAPHPTLDVFRQTFIVIDWILVFAFIFAFIKSLKYRPKLHPKVQVKKKTFTLRNEVFKNRWAGVRAKVDAGTTDGVRLAIIDADKLADDVLRQMGKTGEHMADRLAQIKESEVRSLERLWRAHRVRNDLVHSPGFAISLIDAKRVIDDYEAFLKEVKALS